MCMTDGAVCTRLMRIICISRNTAALILKIAYGWTVQSDDDPFIKYMEEGFHMAVEGRLPGRWLVEVFPIREH